MKRLARFVGIGWLLGAGLQAPTVRADDPLEAPDAALEDDPTVLSEERPPSPERTAHNVVFLELGGNALLYSVNYERFVGDEFSFRLGFGHLGIGSPSFGFASASASLSMFPVLVNYVGVGGAAHRLELGFGVLPVYASARAEGGGSVREWDSGLSIMPTSSVAYRYVPRDGGIDFKLGFAPTYTPIGLIPMLSVAAGVVF